jgi:hypothetical protein
LESVSVPLWWRTPTHTTTTATITARLFATGAITLTIPTHAHPTAITARSGLPAASLLEQARGTAGAGVMPATTADATGVDGNTGTATAITAIAADMTADIAMATAEVIAVEMATTATAVEMAIVEDAEDMTAVAFTEVVLMAAALPTQAATG